MCRGLDAPFREIFSEKCSRLRQFPKCRVYNRTGGFPGAREAPVNRYRRELGLASDAPRPIGLQPRTSRGKTPRSVDMGLWPGQLQIQFQMEIPMIRTPCSILTSAPLVIHARNGGTTSVPREPATPAKRVENGDRCFDRFPRRQAPAIKAWVVAIAGFLLCAASVLAQQNSYTFPTS